YTICPGQSVTLEPTCLNEITTTGHSFLWGPATGLSSTAVLTPNASPSVTTVYYLSIDTWLCAVPCTVNVVPVQTDFSFNEFDNCEDKPVAFTVSDDSDPGPGTFSFGDGTYGNYSSPPVTINHTYANPGYYTVTMVPSDDCYATISKIIHILPSIGNYNWDCCVSDFQNYTYPGNYYITGINNHWTTAQSPITVKGTITIKPGAKLYIDDGVTVHFGPQGKIIVERGAELNIGAATLQKLFSFYKEPGCPVCDGMMWQGIEVWGKYNSSSAANSGKLILTNSTIRDAHNAVILGKTVLVPQGNGFQYNGHDADYGGGILQAVNTQFINNATNIRIWDYIGNNTCIIDGCTFTCIVLEDSYYSSLNSPNYSTPSMKLHNPFYPDANALHRSSFGIITYKKKPYILVKGSHFDNITYGISSTDTRLYVKDQCEFNDHDYGIFIDNTVASYYYSASITNNYTFTDIKQRGVYIADGKGDVVKKNLFENTSTNQADYQHGIYIVNSTGFMIMDNEFVKLEKGILIHGTDPNTGNAGRIGFETEGNTFTACSLAVQSAGNNPGLKVKCNNFYPSSSFGYYYNWRVAGTAFPQQGENVLYDHHKPAGNEFFISGLKQIYSFNIPFIYVHHHYPPTTKPAYTSSLLIDNLSDKDYTQGSGSCYPGGYIPHIALINELDVKIGSLYNELENVTATLDYGNTQGLLAAIESNMPAGKLKNMLINHSPLSDQTLTAFITRQESSPPGIFKETMTPNLPVSDNVLPCLDSKLTSLPPGIASQIRALQANNPDYRTTTAINRDIQYYGIERSNLLYEAVGHWIENDSAGYAVGILEQENTLQAAEILFGHYLSEENISQTGGKLDILAGAGWDEDFAALAEMRMALMADSLTIFDITPAQDSMLRQIAYNDSSSASTPAQAILWVLYNTRIDNEPDIGEVSAKSLPIVSNPYQSESSDNTFILGLRPNPVKDRATLWYKLPENCTDAKLTVFDGTGREVRSFFIP
ncbi:MAG: hypothetical protein KJ607_07365, partial [Bacteroidetes bacterium]|nr:hypothetical protein [Bacteroidota bacterium]